jgi:antitoxin Phd
MASTRGEVLFIGEGAALATASRNLTQAGFQMHSASRELEALELADKVHYDVLIVDLDLSHVDGVSLLRRWRERGSTTSVVWLSSKPNNALVATAAEVGVLQLLQKPTDAKALERVVTVAADRSRNLLAVLRAIVRPSTPPRSVAATDAKNEFGAILDTAVQDGAVVITKRDTPRAVLVSVDRVGALLAKLEPDLQALTHEFDELVARMQTPKARAAARGLFSADASRLGAAAVAGVKKRHG